ncbi:MAG: MmcQ/YjbR family DNA-binding protein [Planctomycetota bacterium]
MTVAQFRKIALTMPEAEESAHMGHPDFRVRGKIFATLFTRDDIEWGMLKLKPEQQRRLVNAHPEVFQPIKGGWGRQGCTQVRLDAVDKAALRSPMLAAWRIAAPKSLVEEMNDSDEP